jgi:pimeloyl-ACP methyl ester carboxylesterase
MEEKKILLSTGITMSFAEAGNPRGEPVLLLHGYTDTRRSFLDTAAHLAALRPDLRFVLCDLRGHGGSSLPAASYRSAPERAFRNEDFAADVIAFMDAQRIGRAHIIGHSLGSFVAQEIALRHQDRVGQIVLLGSSAKFVDNPVMQELVLAQLLERMWREQIESRGLIFPDDAYELTPRDLDPDAEAWLLANWVSEPLADPGLLAQIAADAARMPIGAWLGVARAVLAMDNRQRLLSLRAEPLVLYATQDAICPERPDQELLLASLQAASERTGLRYASKRFGERPLPPSGMTEDDLGHNFHWAIPDLVANEAAAFLERPAARSNFS